MRRVLTRVKAAISHVVADMRLTRADLRVIMMTYGTVIVLGSIALLLLWAMPETTEVALHEWLLLTLMGIATAIWWFLSSIPAHGWIIIILVVLSWWTGPSVRGLEVSFKAVLNSLERIEDSLRRLETRSKFDDEDFNELT